MGEIFDDANDIRMGYTNPISNDHDFTPSCQCGFWDGDGVVSFLTFDRFLQYFRPSRSFKEKIMNAPSLLSELEENISRLPIDEQLLLIERVSHRIRKNISDKQDIDTQLSEMASDPEIQRELQEIEREFSVTEQDGLGN